VGFCRESCSGRTRPDRSATEKLEYSNYLYKKVNLIPFTILVSIDDSLGDTVSLSRRITTRIREELSHMGGGG
jgi:hypothetical protein